MQNNLLVHFNVSSVTEVIDCIFVARIFQFRHNFDPRVLCLPLLRKEGRETWERDLSWFGQRRSARNVLSDEERGETDVFAGYSAVGHEGLAERDKANQKRRNILNE